MPGSRITREDVLHVAQLARLELADDEIDGYAHQLGIVLDHAQDMAALDLEGVEPTAHPLPLVNVVRPDTPGPMLDRAEVLAAAPDVEDHRFRVPRILDAQ